jgi:hypothetical protein
MSGGRRLRVRDSAMMVKQMLSGSVYRWVIRQKKESCDVKRRTGWKCGCSHDSNKDTVTVTNFCIYRTQQERHHNYMHP